MSSELCSLEDDILKAGIRKERKWDMINEGHAAEPDLAKMRPQAGPRTYQVFFKSGATIVLKNVELVPNLDTNPPRWVLKRNGLPICFTPTYKPSADSYSTKPLDDVIDAIIEIE